MFEDDDPLLARVREIALVLPEAAEKISHGRPAFFTKKIFTYYGGSLKVDGEWVQHPHSIVFLPDGDEREALVQDVRGFVPAYLGPSGWIGIDIDDRTEWDEVAEMLDTSYRLTAPTRCVATLEERRSP
ncbi:MAG: MmcQ/YjbR family DNA-binding protein [Microthrixaceae bacterium]